MNLQVVPPYLVARAWEHAHPYIVASQQRGPVDEVTPQYMRQSCIHDPDWCLVLFTNGEEVDTECIGAAVVRILDDALFVSALGGELPKGWPDYFHGWLLHTAKTNGKQVIRFGGRRGWRRLLKHLGYVSAGGPYMECWL